MHADVLGYAINTVSTHFFAGTVYTVVQQRAPGQESFSWPSPKAVALTISPERLNPARRIGGYLAVDDGHYTSLKFRPWSPVRQPNVWV